MDFMKISHNMKIVLRSLIEGNTIGDLNKNSIQSLRSRLLINDHNQLTRTGWILAISYAKLDRQCKFLGIHLEELEIDYSNFPEKSALKYFENNGYIGTNAEGGAILNVIKALMLEKLYEHNLFKDRADACCRYLEAQFTILNSNKLELISSIKTTSKELFLNNFLEIISTDFISGLYPELKMEFAEAFYEAIDLNYIISIANKFSEDPYKYRSGWPDLILIKDNKIQFVEVKTSDKLHINQIETISAMKELVPYEFKVIKLTSIKK